MTRAVPPHAVVDVWAAGRRREPRRAPVAFLSAVSLGGGLGALARYGLDGVFPATAGGFPWATFVINVSGCLLIGVLMVLLGQVWAGHRLARPFLGIGVLGGFTTFSTYVVDVQQLVAAHAAGTALVYLAATLIAALAATVVGLALARWAVVRMTHRGASRVGHVVLDTGDLRAAPARPGAREPGGGGA